MEKRESVRANPSPRRPISHFPAGRSPTIYNSLEDFSGVAALSGTVAEGEREIDIEGGRGVNPVLLSPPSVVPVSLIKDV